MSRKDSELEILKSFIENNCKAQSNSSGKIIEQLNNSNNLTEPIITSGNINPSNTHVCNKFKIFSPVGDKQNSLLYRELSDIAEVNTDRPFCGNSIEDLIKELNNNGPLRGMGYYGQSFYTSNVVSISHNFADTAISVNGWPPNSYKDNKSIAPQNIIIVGAKKDGDKKYVYYISLPTPEKNQFQIYVISYARYIESRKNISISENVKESNEGSSGKKLPHLRPPRSN